MKINPKALELARKGIATPLPNGVTAQKLKDGRLFSEAAIDEMIAEDPDGRMNASAHASSRQFDNAAAIFDRHAEGFGQALSRLIETEAKISSQIPKMASKVKDNAQSLAESFGRINKMVGPDFEGRLCQLERLVDALEKLQALRSRGLLDSLLAALTAQK